MRGVESVEWRVSGQNATEQNATGQNATCQKQTKCHNVDGEIRMQQKCYKDVTKIVVENGILSGI